MKVSLPVQISEEKKPHVADKIHCFNASVSALPSSPPHKIKFYFKNYFKILKTFRKTTTFQGPLGCLHLLKTIDQLNFLIP